MEKVIIEIIHANRLRKEYKVFNSLPVRIGRGFDNDIIISDPYLSENHAVINREAGEEGWFIEDLNSRNGLYSVKDKKNVVRADINSGDIFEIGKTRICVMSSAHSVPPALPIVRMSKFLTKISRPVSVCLLSVLMLLVFAVSGYLESHDEVQQTAIIMGCIGVYLAILAWCGIWALIGRIIKSRSQFATQLAVTCLFFILTMPLEIFNEVVNYATRSTLFSELIETLFYGIFVAVLLFYNLSIATNLSAIKKHATILVIVLIIMMMETLSFYDNRNEFRNHPEYNASLKPVFFKLRSSKTVDVFLKDSEKVFQKMDK